MSKVFFSNMHSGFLAHFPSFFLLLIGFGFLDLALS